MTEMNENVLFAVVAVDRVAVFLAASLSLWCCLLLE